MKPISRASARAIFLPTAPLRRQEKTDGDTSSAAAAAALAKSWGKGFNCSAIWEDLPSKVKQQQQPSCSAANREKDRRIKLAYKKLKEKLKELADEIDQRNIDEPHKAFNAFNPRQLEWSVSV